MIKIEKIRVENYGIRTRMIANINLPFSTMDIWEKKASLIDKNMKGRYRKDFVDSEGNYELWYEVDSSYSYAFCPERCDAFLIACLYYAMVSGEDIYCEVPVTENLLYQIREYIIPSLCIEQDGYRMISIQAEAVPEVKKEDAFVGTGISCGVDSFSTIVLHLKPEIPDSFKLTHLTLFNTGSLNWNGYSKNKPLDKWREETEKEFADRIKLGRLVANELGLQFLDVNTNIPELYQGCFMFSHTFRNCSSVLATQKIWRNYYYSSAGEGEINIAAINKSQGSYDCLNTMALSLNSLRFYSSGMPYKRLQKINIIADYPFVQKYLNVCVEESYNCGKCSKCIRTLSELDLIGKINNFTNSFANTSYYWKNKWRIFASIIEAKKDDPFLYEMKRYIEINNIPIGWKTKIYHCLLPLRKAWVKLNKKKG